MATESTGEILSPSQLNTLARGLLEDAFPLVWVEGELSSVARPAHPSSGGHEVFPARVAIPLAEVRARLAESRERLERYREPPPDPPPSQGRSL